jgi:cytochrome c-type biogenesis protein CcmH/NrfF
VVVNPLVDWVWLGFGIMAFGTGIALLPESTYSFALAKLPADAVATGAAILLAVLLVGAPTRVFAQHMAAPGSIISAPTNDVEKKLRDEMGCTCGGCAHEPLSKCTCSQANEMRAVLREQVALGKSHDEIVNYFIGTTDKDLLALGFGGQQFLGAPVDKGFNRLAWFLPYLLGAGGIAAVGFAAMRWSKHPSESADATDVASASDAALNERLDDELRNLD